MADSRLTSNAVVSSLFDGASTLFIIISENFYFNFRVPDPNATIQQNELYYLLSILIEIDIIGEIFFHPQIRLSNDTLTTYSLKK